MRVVDHMNPNPARIGDRESLREAVRIFAASQAADLMVVGSDGEFVGILSEGDVIRAALPQLDDLIEEMQAGPGLPKIFDIFADKSDELSRSSIDDLIIRNPVTLKPGDHIHRAAATMAARNIRRLPVVQEGRLVGTLSRADVCMAIIR